MHIQYILIDIQFSDGSPAVRKSLFNVQLCRYLVVVTGVGSVVLYSFPGNHVHLQEGASIWCSAVMTSSFVT